MNLIKYLTDYHDEGHLGQDRIWAHFDATDQTGHLLKATRVDDQKIYWNDWHWQINFQYALKIEFGDGTIMVFKGGSAAKDKVNDDGVDLVTFMQNYIDNNYELPTNDNYIDLDDIII